MPLNTGAAEAGVAQAQAALNLAGQNLADCEIKSPMDGVVGRVDVAVERYDQSPDPCCRN